MAGHHAALCVVGCVREGQGLWPQPLTQPLSSLNCKAVADDREGERTLRRTGRQLGWHGRRSATQPKLICLFCRRTCVLGQRASP
eukprot:9365381-Lingulodinium_polyedra.AAC.1